MLGRHQGSGEVKAPGHRSAAVQGIGLERKQSQRDSARHLLTLLSEVNRIIQARGSRIRREVEVDGPCDQPPCYGGLPRTQLAAEKERWPESIADMVKSA